LFFNEDNKIIFRANGYYPPEKFSALLSYIGEKKERTTDYQDYVVTVDTRPSSGRLHDDVNSVSSTTDLSLALKNASDKLLLVMFEQKKCNTCDDLHLDILKRETSIELLTRFKVIVLDMWSSEILITPTGKKMKIRDWAKSLNVKYAPSLIFFDNEGKEVFRADAYLKAFHMQSVMDYVSSSEYKIQKNFQRYIDARAAHLREQGIEVNLME